MTNDQLNAARSVMSQYPSVRISLVRDGAATKIVLSMAKKDGTRVVPVYAETSSGALSSDLKKACQEMSLL